VHNTDEALPVGSRLLHNALLGPFRRFAIHFSDTIVGISVHVLNQFMKGYRSEKKKAVVLYYGIDMQPFSVNADPVKLKAELSIPQDAKLLLFCGRMNEFKNPVFVVDILDRLLKQEKNYYAVFVGEGDLAKQVIEKAATYNISDHVIMAGWRNDLPAVMKSADVFIFPRLEKPKEGLGLVVVEAQAAGLPMLLTNGIPEDAIEIPELAEFLPLDNNPEQWAQSILGRKETISRHNALALMRSSKFELSIATKNLLNLYE
jgi:glycosyltransferase involved in cell wall biosynthesis